MESGADVQRSIHAARQIAATVVSENGPHLVTEDVNVRAWYRLWGKALRVTTPGRVLDAIKAEAEACGGGMLRASTYTTALSQHCVCGRREKKPLSQRTHTCPGCGLVADRDLLAAALAACVTLADPADPRSATLNQDFVTALRGHVGAQQEALVRSTTSQPNPSVGWDGERGSNEPVASAGHGNSTVLPQHNPTRVSLDQTPRMNLRKQLRINS